jgi:cell division protein FtsB
LEIRLAFKGLFIGIDRYASTEIEKIQEAVAPAEKRMQDLEQENQQPRAEVARLNKTGN